MYPRGGWPNGPGETKRNNKTMSSRGVSAPVMPVKMPGDRPRESEHLLCEITQVQDLRSQGSDQPVVETPTHPDALASAIAKIGSGRQRSGGETSDGGRCCRSLCTSSLAAKNAQALMICSGLATKPSRRPSMMAPLACAGATWCSWSQAAAVPGDLRPAMRRINANCSQGHGHQLLLDRVGRSAAVRAGRGTAGCPAEGIRCGDATKERTEGMRGSYSSKLADLFKGPCGASPWSSIPLSPSFATLLPRVIRADLRRPFRFRRASVRLEGEGRESAGVEEVRECQVNKTKEWTGMPLHERGRNGNLDPGFCRRIQSFEIQRRIQSILPHTRAEYQHKTRKSRGHTCQGSGTPFWPVSLGCLRGFCRTCRLLENIRSRSFCTDGGGTFPAEGWTSRL